MIVVPAHMFGRNGLLVLLDPLARAQLQTWNDGAEKGREGRVGGSDSPFSTLICFQLL